MQVHRFFLRNSEERLMRCGLIYGHAHMMYAVGWRNGIGQSIGSGAAPPALACIPWLWCKQARTILWQTSRPSQGELKRCVWPGLAQASTAHGRSFFCSVIDIVAEDRRRSGGLCAWNARELANEESRWPIGCRQATSFAYSTIEHKKFKDDECSSHRCPVVVGRTR